MDPIIQALMSMFSGMGTPASFGPGGFTPAGGANPGMITQLLSALDPANPLAGLLKMISGFSMLPFANQQENIINHGINLLQNPQAFMGQYRALARPLNRELVRSVQQGAQGSAAEAGLGQSAGAIASATAKALAPYQQENVYHTEDLAMNQIQDLLRSAMMPGSPYARLAGMFGGGSAGGDLGF